MNTADTESEETGLDGNVDVTIVSPGWSPGVSDDVVGLSSGGNTISDSSDGVIKGSTAFLGVHDTTSVSLEDLGVSLNGDGNWSLSNGGKKGLG